MNNKIIYGVLLAVSVIILVYIYNKHLEGTFNLQIQVHKSKPLENETYVKHTDIKEVKLNTYKNLQWIFNNNIMQYSAYIVKHESNLYTIEIIMAINLKHGEMFVNETIGLVQIHETNEILSVIPIKIMKLAFKSNKRVSLPYDKNKIKDSNISVAVIKIQDFTKLKDNVQLDKSPKVFPFYFIKYQIPDQIDVYEPRVKQVGHCTKYVHKFSTSIVAFIDLAKQFQYGEVVLHDFKGELTKFIDSNKEKYEFVTIHPYERNEDIICANRQITNTSFLKVYVDECSSFVNTGLGSYNHDWHQDLNINDCYIKLGAKYEFVSVFDVDEIVFPRTFRPGLIHEKQIKFNCENQEICRYEPFSISLYDYLKQVIRNNYADNPRKLNGINFPHTSYLIPHALEIHLIKAIRNATESIRLKEPPFDKFPIMFNLTGPENGHTFEIQEKDVDYLNYLIQHYDSASCLFQTIRNMTNVDLNFRRYMYHTTPNHLRFGKAVHISKNVEIVDCHWATKVKYGTRKISGNYVNGEFLAHFRTDFIDVYTDKGKSSVKDLSIDIEYISYLMKTYSNFCDEKFY